MPKKLTGKNWKTTTGRISKTYEMTKFCQKKKYYVGTIHTKGDSGDTAKICGTLSCHTYPRHCAYKIKKKTCPHKKTLCKVTIFLFIFFGPRQPPITVFVLTKNGTALILRTAIMPVSVNLSSQSTTCGYVE
jgi:hypothetical protein